MRISVFGVGYVGLTTAACLANLGHEVLCCDVDSNKIEQLQRGEVFFFEPGLPELVKKCQKKLTFTTNKKQAVEFGEVIFNCVGTPSLGNGEADLSYVFSVAKTIATYLNSYKVIVNKSTVPPGTAKRTYEIINTCGEEFHLVANPEFLREGQAIRAFNYPDKIVIGSNSEKANQIMRKVYSGRMRTYLPFIETDWETAELIKYANNTLLATKISFINEMANICDKVGADVKMVSLALGMDYRISPRFLNPGVGYGGSCFPKDVRALIETAKQHNYQADLFKQVDLLNEKQKKIMINKVLEVLGEERGALSILGLSFKPKTSDMREAPSQVIVTGLLELGFQIKVFDPEAMEEAKSIFLDKVEYSSSVENAVADSKGILLLTEWDEFRNLDLGELGRKMKNKILFDGRNIYEPEQVLEEGFRYVGVGRCNK